MPISNLSNISPILARIKKVKEVNSILDVGVGFGKYGMLLREHRDVRFKRYTKETWKTRIDGVEIYPGYITPAHEYIYDNIYLGHIHDLLDTLESYDIILMLECLEHMSKWKGIEVAESLFSKCNKLIIFSFPNYFNGNEGFDWENTHERHRCLWTPAELEDAIGEIETLKPTVFAKEK